MRRRSVAPAMWLILGLSGCPGEATLTETGNPELSARVAMQGRTSDPAAASLGVEGPGLIIEHARIGLERVRLVKATACDSIDEVEFEVPLPGEVELVAGSEPVQLQISPGGYCGMRVQLADLLDGASVQIAGKRADAVPFELASQHVPDIDLRSAIPFSLAEGHSALVVSFDVARWLGGVPLDEAVVSEDGTVHVGDGENEAILDAFEQRLDQAAEVFLDVDSDGTLDDDEDESSLASSGVGDSDGDGIPDDQDDDDY